MNKPIPFGKYLLLERVNVGGMAEVFKAKAFGVEGFERLVAVKRILPSIAEDQEFITMFIDEAKISVQLSHANVAQIFDLGRVGESYFIAMEYVHGKDVRAIFDRVRKRGETMPVPMACYLVMKVCEGLDYAHNKTDVSGRSLNLVHRDVSPQNILTSYDGEIKLIDFGIAKAANRSGKTQAGILKGKFGYMSPEQVRGLPVDRRSDVFSVGIVLYESLTGERLFLGESDFSTLEKVRNVDIRPPSNYNRRIPEELEHIVLRALSKDVEDRYQTAMDLHDDLQSFMYTSGNFFARRDLSAYMRRTFADEIVRETARDEEYQNYEVPGAMAPEEFYDDLPMYEGSGLEPLPAIDTLSSANLSHVPQRTPMLDTDPRNEGQAPPLPYSSAPPPPPMAPPSMAPPPPPIAQPPSLPPSHAMSSMPPNPPSAFPPPVPPSAFPPPSYAPPALPPAAEPPPDPALFAAHPPTPPPPPPAFGGAPAGHGAPSLSSPALSSPALSSPALSSPALSSPSLSSPALSSPALGPAALPPRPTPRTGAPPPLSTPPRPSPDLEMGWDEDELATQIYDRPEDRGVNPSSWAVPPTGHPSPFDSPGYPSAGVNGNGAPSPFGPPAHAWGPNGEHAGEPSPFDPPYNPSAYAPIEPEPVEAPARRAPEPTEVTPRGSASRRGTVILLMAGLLALFAVFGFGSWWVLRPAEPGTIQFTTDPSDPVVLLDDSPVHATSSPFVISNVEPNVVHLLEVRKRGYRTWSMQVEVQNGKNLQLSQIKLVRLGEEKSAEKPAKAAAGTGFAIESEPKDANIFVDGKKLSSRTPAKVTDLAAGRHTIRLELDGHEPWSSQVEVAKDQVLSIPKVTLRASSFGVRVRSTPPGASVVLTRGMERRHVGNTPTQFDVEVEGDPWTVEMTLPGYQPWRRELTVSAERETQDLDATLQTAATAEPAPAPARRKRRRRARRASAPAVQPAAAPVAAAPAAPAFPPAQAPAAPAFGAQPAPAAPAAPQGVAAAGQTGKLRINSRPWSQVYVDGRLVGNTPQMNISLPAGPHRVTLVNPDFRVRQTVNVNIAPGQTVTRIVTLNTGQ